MTSATRRTVRMCEVKRMMGTCRTTLEKWIALGRFPKPLNVGIAGRGAPRLWAADDIEAVLNGTWTPPSTERTDSGR